MNLVLVRITLAGLWLLAILAGSVGLMWPIEAKRLASSAPRLPPHTTVAVDTLDAALERAVARAPFRATRRLATVAYDPSRLVDLVSPAVPAPPKPILALSGIVWGYAPTAVVEGIPGIDGPRLVQRGDVIGALTIRRIEPTRVVVVGLDTIWSLTVRTPWR